MGPFYSDAAGLGVLCFTTHHLLRPCGEHCEYFFLSFVFTVKGLKGQSCFFTLFLGTPSLLGNA